MLYSILSYHLASFDLKTICNELSEVKYKYDKIGMQLGISYGKLMELKKEDDPLAASVDYWLKGNVKDVPLSWSSVVAALESRHVDEHGLAKEIKDKYCQGENIHYMNL